MSDLFVVMCDDYTTAEDAGDRTGTVVAIYASEDAADEALQCLASKAQVQRRTYEEWSRLSYEENPLRDTSKELVKMGGAIIDRNKRRKEWIKAHPVPPTDLLRRFWMVQIEGPAGLKEKQGGG